MNIDESSRQIPVILDTDIGTDIDDTWALIMLLKMISNTQNCAFDLKLLSCCHGDTLYRAKLAALALSLGGFKHVPVAIGEPTSPTRPDDQVHPLRQFVKGIGFDGEHISGCGADGSTWRIQARTDAVTAIIDTILSHYRDDQPVVLIAIGPFNNVGAALAKEPSIASKTKLVAMAGSVRKGYNNSDDVVSEYNVKVALKQAQLVFSVKWFEFILTPLDTCGIIRIRGSQYARLLCKATKDPLLQSLFEQYRVWLKKMKRLRKLYHFTEESWKNESTVLFDTVAIFLAARETFLNLELLRLRVDDAGFTRETPIDSEEGTLVRTALTWKRSGTSGFKHFLVETLELETV